MAPGMELRHSLAIRKRTLVVLLLSVFGFSPFDLFDHGSGIPATEATAHAEMLSPLSIASNSETGFAAQALSMREVDLINLVSRVHMIPSKEDPAHTILEEFFHIGHGVTKATAGYTTADDAEIGPAGAWVTLRLCSDEAPRSCVVIERAYNGRHRAKIMTFMQAMKAMHPYQVPLSDDFVTTLDRYVRHTLPQFGSFLRLVDRIDDVELSEAPGKLLKMAGPKRMPMLLPQPTQGTDVTCSSMTVKYEERGSVASFPVSIQSNYQPNGTRCR